MTRERQAWVRSGYQDREAHDRLMSAASKVRAYAQATGYNEGRDVG
jgi:hypothetical protein